VGLQLQPTQAALQTLRDLKRQIEKKKVRGRRGAGSAPHQPLPGSTAAQRCGAPAG
jgi:hypothetical protein